MAIEALVFYSPSCARCHEIKHVIRDVQPSLKGIAKFSFINCDRGTGRWLCDKWNVTRIPSILVKTNPPDIYFVGVPAKSDLITMMSYLYRHPEGGKGVHHG